MVTVKPTPDDVGVTDVGLKLQVDGTVPVQVRATELLYPFKAVAVPLKTAFCVGKIVWLLVVKLN